jgi:hypothetical protein
VVAKKVKATEELNAERNAKAGRDRGSLSISIVAIESGVTHPKKPASSQGGYRDYGLITGNAPGAQNPDECVSPKAMDSLGGEPVALRNRMRQSRSSGSVGGVVWPAGRAALSRKQSIVPELVYYGRIDDRYVEWAKRHEQLSANDLQEVLDAVLGDESVEFRRTVAVGCSIPALDPE